MGDSDCGDEKGVRANFDGNEETVETRTPRKGRRGVVSKVKKSVSVVCDINKIETILKTLPGISKSPGGGRKGSTGSVSGQLDKIQIPTHKSRDRGINREKTLENGGVETKLPSRVKVKVEKLKGGATRILRRVTPKLNVTLGQRPKGDGGPSVKVTKAGGVDDQSAGHTLAKAIKINMAVLESTGESKVFAGRELSFLKTDNVGTF